VFLLLAVFAVFAVAQERTGELNGVATDQSKAVLPNVNITATNKATGRELTTKTGGAGAFVLRGVDPGRYTVKFEAQGFTPLEFGDVLVVAGRVLTLNGELNVGTTTQSVEVSGAAPLIDTTTTAVGHNVTQEEFDRLPKTRTFQSLANASPSVTAGEVTEGGIQVNGASGAENQFTVDGMTTTSLIQGNSRENTAFEFLEEVQVKTSGIEAQYGGALGGVISAITRSGGNAFHGDVHYYYQGSRINADQAHRMLMSPTDLLTITTQQDTKIPMNRSEAGYALGGYFIKNHVYFFSAASPTWINEKQTVLAADKTPVNLNRDTTLWQAYEKLSMDVTRNLRATLSFLWTPSSAAGTLAAYNYGNNQSTLGVTALQANQARGWFSPQTNYNASVDWTITPTTFLSVRAARFWDNYKAIGVLGQSAIEWGQPSTTIPGIPAILSQAKGYDTIPRVQTTAFDIAARNMVQADFSHFMKLGGMHDIKVGGGRQKNVNKVDNSYPGGGFVTLQWGSSLTLPNGTTATGKYGYYQVDDIGTKGSTGGTIDNFYVQDRCRIGSRLSLDLGVRLEKEVIPSFRKDIAPYAFKFGWGQKVAPRLGGSYDLLGNGKVKIYGSWGRFYDWVKYELARGTFGADVWRTYYRPLDSIDPTVVLGLGNGNMPGANLWPTAYQDWRIPAFGAGVVDPNIRPMSTYMASAGVEWQLSPKFMAAARYTHNSLRTTIEDIGTLIDGSETYIYGNPGLGTAKMSSPSSASVPSFQIPEAKRTYDALELSFPRRFASRWFASGSYVYSRLWGDYAGLQNSDEVYPASSYLGSGNSQQQATTAYRPGSSATRAYDLDYYMYDSHGNRDVTGVLGSDKPHTLKLYGAYTLPWKAGESTIGPFFRINSGVPVTTLVQDVQNIPLFVNGRGDLGRTPVFSNTDLLLTHDIKFGESAKRLHFEFNFQNLFNQKISQLTYMYYNRLRTRSSGMSMNFDFTKGYDYKKLVAASPDAARSTGALDPRFGKPDSFSPGFSGRFGVKFLF